MNLNDAMKNKPWSLTAENLRSLEDMLPIAREQRALGHEMFVNHAGFFPDLRPSDYAPLVRQVSELVRQYGVRANDGQGLLGRIRLRDPCTSQ